MAFRIGAYVALGLVRAVGSVEHPSGRGRMVAESIWGAPAPNGLLGARRTADHPRAQADAVSAGFDVSAGNGGLSGALPEVAGGLWVHPVLDSRGNLRATVNGREWSGNGGPSRPRVCPCRWTRTQVL